MKAKVIIENGETTIVLTPQNEFEIDLIEKFKDKKEKHTIHTHFSADYKNHHIELSIKEERP